MKQQNVKDLVIALLMYCVLTAIVYLGPAPVFLGTDLTMDSPKDAHLLMPMVQTFQDDAITLVVASLVCFLIWYFLGEYVTRPNAPTSSRILTWSLLLVLILMVASFETWNASGHLGSQSLYSLVDVGLCFFIPALLLYYLASVVASPPNAKYVIWPARKVRR